MCMRHFSTLNATGSSLCIALNHFHNIATFLFLHVFDPLLYNESVVCVSRLGETLISFWNSEDKYKRTSDRSILHIFYIVTGPCFMLRQQWLYLSPVCFTYFSRSRESAGIC